MRYNFTPTRMAIIKTVENNKCEEIRILVLVDQSVKWELTLSTLVSSSYKWGTWWPDKLGDLYGVTQPVRVTTMNLTTLSRFSAMHQMQQKFTPTQFWIWGCYELRGLGAAALKMWCYETAVDSSMSRLHLHSTVIASTGQLPHQAAQAGRSGHLRTAL